MKRACPNQSVNGLLNRWFHNGDSLVFEDHAFSPPHSIVAAGTTIAAIVLLGLAFLLPFLCPRRDRRFDLPIVAMTATVVSPIAWEHHYAVALPLFAIVLPASLEAPSVGGWKIVTLAASFLLLGQYLRPAGTWRRLR